MIYGLIDSDTLELRYIGQTSYALDVRFKEHKKCRTNNHHLNNWIRSTNVNAIVLERDPIDLDEAEMCWISDMREQGARLLNLTDGGGGLRGHSFTDEHRAKMSEAHTGMKFTDEHRTNISIVNKGKILSQEHKDKIKKSNEKYWRKPENRHRMSIIKIGTVPWNKGIKRE